MAKTKTQYVCSNCGYVSPKWNGSCPQCGKWNTFEEQTISKKSSSSHKAKVEGLDTSTSPQKLDDVETSEKTRFKSNISELDRVLGGGFLPGSYVLIGGEPGVGKSTLTLQIAKSNPELSILYCAGEESAGQIKQRASRLGVDSDKLLVYNETQVDTIIAEAQKMQPDLLIVDSIQTVYRTELSSMPGSIQQVKECAALFQQLSKKKNITTLVIGHVTKEGDIAGPRVLEHMVDTVLQFEGDKQYTYRLLRSLKNRFGAAQEVGVFEMKSDGLSEVSNPSELFISDKTSGVSGNAVVCTMEGTRPLLIEVQALVTPSAYGSPQRTANGFDRNRLALLLAVLEKRVGRNFSNHDVYLNIAGGFRLNDPAGDLGVCCALVSSLMDDAVSSKMAFIGEVGLGGEIRSVPHLEQREREARKLGYEQIVLPGSKQKKGIRYLHEAIKKALG
ncbi:DNA repair protein RadA [Gracilimonas mengyeensis]|uniref:DNA repair protein RadA n=1 Tax=Gracilimonas mengyeensis TaxID=1302730 RepID=A0A521E0S9_9BACT|nr:DNA repair protein RadA [Gracilimonas mengyeensis]SMO77567.1 DNA repair protein RadA/Sms [Gracilimonas mengyeensis]